MKFLNLNYEQNFNDIEIKVGNDKENDIIKVSDVNKEYLYMKEIVIHFIRSYTVKKFDDTIFIHLITNYKVGFGIWNIMMEIKNVNDFKKGAEFYIILARNGGYLYIFRQ